MPYEGEPQSSEPAEREDSAGVGMYRVAYEEGIRTIDDQASELDALRQRVMQFLAFTGSATAFLVGAGLNQTVRSGSFRGLALVGTAVSLLAIGCTLLVLFGLHFVFDSGWKNLASRSLKARIRAAGIWQFRLKSKVLVEGWIDPDLGGDSEREFLRALALFYDDEARANEAKLARIRLFSRLAVLLGSLQILLWAALVWLFR